MAYRDENGLELNQRILVNSNAGVVSLPCGMLILDPHSILRSAIMGKFVKTTHFQLKPGLYMRGNRVKPNLSLLSVMFSRIP